MSLLALKVLLVSAVKSLLLSLLTERFVKELILDILAYFAEKTDNTVDDKAVAQMRRSLKP